MPRLSTDDPTTAPAAGAKPTLAQPERFPWLPILVLGFAWFLAVAIELSPAGLLGAIAADLDVSVVAVGTLTTFYALGNALLVLPLTALAIRFARRTALNVVMIVFVASNLAVALAPTIAIADIGRFVGGASYGVICTLFPAVVIRIAGPRYAGKAITVVFTATSLGVALGAPLASLIGNALGWRITFLGAAALAAIAGVLMSVLVPKIREGAHKPLTLLQTAREPGVLRVAIGWSLVMLAHFVVLTYIEAYLANVGLPTYVTSISLLLIGVGGIVGTLLIGRISSRSVFGALVAGPAVVAGGLAVLFLGGGNLAVVLAGIALWGMVCPRRSSSTSRRSCSLGTGPLRAPPASASFSPRPASPPDPRSAEPPSPSQALRPSPSSPSRSSWARSLAAAGRCRTARHGVPPRDRAAP